MAWENKDPDETKRYTLDFTRHLVAGDSLATATWSAAPSGLTLGTSSISGNKATVWISAGSAATRTYSVQCRATTADGETLDWTETLFVTER